MSTASITSHNPSAPLRVALLGYGNAGRIFHAPLISGVPGLQLACIGSSKPDAVHADWPHVPVLPTPEAVLADPDIDVVVIATSNESHHPLAKAALLASGQLGRIVQVESHFDRYRPLVPGRWRDQDLPGSGLWFDLGAHLVDQALQLLCPATTCSFMPTCATTCRAVRRCR
jgi:predicted dehydrogenase